LEACKLINLNTAIWIGFDAVFEKGCGNFWENV